MMVAGNSGLLVVDVQGKLAHMVYESPALISNTVKLIRSCEALAVPVIVIEQNPDGLGPTTPDIRAVTQDSDKFEKHTFNALAEPKIREHILNSNKKHWIVAGIEGHVCVYQTVRGLLAKGLDVEVVSDCVSSRKQSNLDLALTNMRHLGAHITSLEMCVFELLQSCQSQVFREVLKIIK